MPFTTKLSYIFIFIFTFLYYFCYFFSTSVLLFVFFFVFNESHFCACISSQELRFAFERKYFSKSLLPMLHNERVSQLSV